MITVIRERLLKNNGAKIIVWALIVILFIVWTVPGMLRNLSGGSSWVVRVNGQDVSYSDFARKVADIENEVEQLRQRGGKYADALLRSKGLDVDPKLLAVDFLVRESLLNQAAQRLQIHINDEFISQKLADAQFVQQELAGVIPPYVVDPARGINESYLKIYLRNARMSFTEFEAKIQEAMLRNVLLECAVAGFYIPLFEVKSKFASDTVGKKFSLLTFSLSDFLKKEKDVAITEQELKNFFEQESKQGYHWVPEKRDALVWTFDPATYGISLTDQEIESYYQEHKIPNFVDQPAHIEVRRIVFAIPSEQEAQDIYKKAKAVQQELVKNPASFAQKAKELSADRETASKGGLMASFAKGKQEPAFDRASFLLKNDGDISDVIRTSKGFEIVQRVSKTAQTFKPLKSVEKEIRALLLKNKFNQQFSQDIKTIIDQKGAQEQALDTAMKERGATAQTRMGIEQDTSRLAQAVFGLKEQEATLYVDGNKGFAVKVTKIHKRHLPPLDTVKATVIERMREHKARKRLQEALKKAQDTVKSKDIQALARELGAEYKATGLIKKSDVGGVATLRAQGLPIDSMLQIEKTGSIGVFEKEKNGYLVRLDEVEAVQEKDLNAKKAGLVAELEQERLKTFAESFVASLYRNATIKPNNSLFAESPVSESLLNEIES
jgi:peptidyl-prolyl cis-trans isomerase D